MKKENGFTAVDIGLALLIIIIFTVTMTSISYNVYLSSTEAKRTAVALNYCVDIFEHIGQLDYEDVNVESGEIFNINSLNDFIQEEAKSENGIQTIIGKIKTYNIELKIEKYRNQNMIKILTLTVTFPVSKNNIEKIEMQRLKVIDV